MANNPYLQWPVFRRSVGTAPSGIRHSVEVMAESIYEAAALWPCRR